MSALPPKADIAHRSRWQVQNVTLMVLQDVRPNVDYAPIDHAERASGARAKIKDTAASEGAAVIYRNDDTSARLGISYQNTSTEG
jgi:hypothetical protein